MYSFLRGDAEKNFREKLSVIHGKNGFEKLKRYHQSLIDSERVAPRDYSFGKKLESRVFFTLPGEFPGASRNCFESSVDLFLAAESLYPESQPKLVYVNEGKRGTHGTVIFRHNRNIYRADAVYQIFAPVVIQKNKMVSPGDDDERVTVFKSIHEVSHEGLERTVNSLRSGDVKLFLTGGGQMVEKRYDVFRPYGIFMKCLDDTLISELRFLDPVLIHNTCARRVVNLKKGTWHAEILVYRRDNWAKLQREKKVISSDETFIREKSYFGSHMTLEEMRKAEVLPFVTHFTKYYIRLFCISKSKNQKMEDLTVFTRKTIDKYVDFIAKEQGKTPMLEYLRNISHNFMLRHADFILSSPHTFLRKERRDKLSREEAEKVTWEDIRKDAHFNSKRLSNAFLGAFFDISVNEWDTLKNYTESVFDMIGAQKNRNQN